jgi:hypothetical protein
VFLAAGNLWFAAVRSTIPLRLNGRATHKQRLTEKTVGVDDVHLITLDDGTRIQVDGPVYEAVVLNHVVRKDAWSRKLEVDGTNINVDWSRDFSGMLWAMPSVLVVFLMLGILANRSRALSDGH